MGMIIYLQRATPDELAQLKASPDRWDEFEFKHSEDVVDFDKSWHALHFMLTGEAEGTGNPLGIIVEDGEEFGVGSHGNVTWISPERMRAFNAALRALDDDTLASRYDPAAMVAQDIYLADMFANEGQGALDYVLESVPVLRKLAASCASARDGVIRVLC